MGNKCHFAHGDHELRNPNDPIPPEMLEIAQKQQTFQKPFQKPYMKQGGHGGPMGGGYQPRPYNQFGGMGGGMHGQGGHGGQHGHGGGANFKTVKCKFFDQGKSCPYGNRCSFAHGDQELREQQAPPMMPPPMPQYNFNAPQMPGGGFMGGDMMSPEMMQYQNMMGNWGGAPMDPNMMGMMAGGFPGQPGMMPGIMGGFPGSGGQEMFGQPGMMMAPQQTRIQIQQQQ